MVGIREEIRLVDVYSDPQSKNWLYRLLQEREPYQSISHKGMPSWEDHCEFVDSKPYAAWYLVKSEDEQQTDIIGTVYLTKRNEIGVHIFKRYQGEGRGPEAITLLMGRHPRKRYIANINPDNKRSLHVFEKFGFHQIGVTLEHMA